MFVKKKGQWVDEGGEVTADKLQEVIENNQEQLGSVIQEAVVNSTGEGISGVAGVNGVSGFLPDWNKEQSLVVTSIGTSDSPEFKATAPNDGWVSIAVKLNVGSSYRSSRMAHFSVNDNPCHVFSPRDGGNCAIVPVKKDDIVKLLVNVGLVSNSYPTFTFYPIYKPDLAEEHVVGYLGGKDVYRKIIDTTSPSVKNAWTTVVSIPLCDKIVSISCIADQTKTTYFYTPLNYTTSNGASVYLYGIDADSNGKNIKILVNNDTFLNKQVTFDVYYTKTTD